MIGGGLVLPPPFQLQTDHLKGRNGREGEECPMHAFLNLPSPPRSFLIHLSAYSQFTSNDFAHRLDALLLLLFDSAAEDRGLGIQMREKSALDGGHLFFLPNVGGPWRRSEACAKMR